MNQWWQYWQGYFKPEECDKIIELAKLLPVNDAKVGIDVERSTSNRNLRRSQVRWLPRFDSRFMHLFGSLELLFHEANRNAFGFDLTMFHEVQFAEYNAEEEGTYGWHHDTTWASTRLMRRKLSLSIQLSDPDTYEGGCFEFNSKICGECPQPEKILQRGTVIIFPSFLEHRVTPVTKGTRNSLVCWMEGPYFK